MVATGAQENDVGWMTGGVKRRAEYLTYTLWAIPGRRFREYGEAIATGDTADQRVTTACRLAAWKWRSRRDYMDYMAEWARRIEGEILESDRPGRRFVVPAADWGDRRNSAVELPVLPDCGRKAAPGAGHGGNTIVIKPSEEIRRTTR